MNAVTQAPEIADPELFLIVPVIVEPAALKDTASQASVKKMAIDLRKKTTSELNAYGYETIPSETNFFMVHIGREIQPVIEEFRQCSMNGHGVRFDGDAGMGLTHNSFALAAARAHDKDRPAGG